MKVSGQNWFAYLTAEDTVTGPLRSEPAVTIETVQSHVHAVRTETPTRHLAWIAWIMESEEDPWVVRLAPEGLRNIRRSWWY